MSRRHPVARSGDLERHAVSELQRARLIAAACRASAESGGASVTVGQIIGHAGVSRRTFYDAFANAEDCLAATVGDALALADERVRVAVAGRESWRESVRRGLLALLALLEEEPALARMLIVESARGGPLVQARRVEACKQLAAAIDRGRRERGTRGAPPPLSAEGVVGAALAIVHRRMLEQPDEALVVLANPLMSLLVLPYLGPDAARAELRRAPPKRRPPAAAPTSRPPGLPMRVTYRTARVLSAIGGEPGASNRQVASAAGVSDQGQISKLLARLQRLGLIRNDGEGQPQGVPNAWRLTPAGEELRSLLSQGRAPATLSVDGGGARPPAVPRRRPRARGC